MDIISEVLIMKNELIIQSAKDVKIKFRNINLSANSKLRYTTSIKNYYEYILKKNLPEGIESVLEWLKSIKNPSTHNISLQSIKEYLIKRFEKEPIERRMELLDAISSVKRKKPKRAITELNYLTFYQVNELASITTESISCFVLSMFWTGCRVSELINIRLNDCICKEFVSIRLVGKGGKEREVYMPRDLFTRIRKFFKGRDYLFETREGDRYKREYITHEIKRQARLKLNININSHLLRHSKAMYLKNERGLSPDQIAKALGHSSVITTLTFYFHGTPSAKDQGII